MLKPFSNLPIYKKILIGPAVVIALSLLAALMGAFQLSRIDAISQDLTSQNLKNRYLQEITVALNAFDNNLERYTTVGGEEHKEHLAADLEAIRNHTALLEELLVADSEKMVRAAALLSELDKNLEALILLQDNLASQGVNEQIVLVYGDIRELFSLFREVDEEVQARFSAALDDQGRRVRLAVNQFIVMEFLILFFGVIIAFMVSRAITAPITELRNTTNLLAKGDSSVRATVLGADEIGELSVSFNQMAEKLSLYTTHLEAEVSARTEELKGKVEEVDKKNQLLVKREEELTLVNERLRELDKAKSEFISVAAHQLRTPLSAIKWTLSLLIDENSGNLTPEQRGLLMKGYESNERIINLINEMLVVTRIESGKVEYTFTPIHLEDLIENALLDFAGQAHVRKMKLAFDKPKTALPYVEADPEKLRGVIQNLIENAVRYTPDGGTVAIAAAAENGDIKVSVKDSGIGIPLRQQSSIFNKFFRADNAVKMQTEGSGLGLFVARSIIEKHGGKIWFESAEGAGTTFYFSIPASKRLA
ncbi:MAG: ATP-binding protein [bacterium]|nr:ATP-binding protein [bacterium]